LREYVVHVHLSDNTGPGGKTHGPIGEGNVDFLGLLRCMRRAKYQGALVIEGYDPSDPEGTTARNYTKLSDLLRQSTSVR
jgi:sugar phosphate isomerase/epimerase